MRLTKEILEERTINRILHIEGNDVTSIEAFPENVNTISIYNTDVEVLPELPDGLEQLVVKNNFFIKDLPNLPTSLRRLYCNNNSLQKLPKLPYGLLVLVCKSNVLKEIPYLPETLILFNCSDNRHLNKLYSKTLNEILDKQIILLRKKKLQNIL